MASPQWRSIPTVLFPQEILDKAFRKASKQADLVEDPELFGDIDFLVPGHMSTTTVSYTHLTLPTKRIV